MCIFEQNIVAIIHTLICCIWFGYYLCVLVRIQSNSSLSLYLSFCLAFGLIIYLIHINSIFIFGFGLLSITLTRKFKHLAMTNRYIHKFSHSYASVQFATTIFATQFFVSLLAQHKTKRHTKKQQQQQIEVL